MIFTKDARIKDSNGKDIGNLNRFVIDPKTHKVTHVVFEEGLLKTTEYVLPMEWVDQVRGDEIVLKPLPVPAEELPHFEEEHFVITDEEAMLENEFIRADPGLRMYYYYPPVTYRPVGAPPDVARRVDPADVGPQPGIVKETEENIPENTIALKEGAKVWSHDQKHVGDVEKIFVDPKDNKATHLLITKGLLMKERKLLPVEWVEDMYEDHVNLAIPENFIDRLPEYKE